jgi:hypothetical protein
LRHPRICLRELSPQFLVAPLLRLTAANYAFPPDLHKLSHEHKSARDTLAGIKALPDKLSLASLASQK